MNSDSLTAPCNFRLPVFSDGRRPFLSSVFTLTTVNSYQGLEADVVIVVTTRTVQPNTGKSQLDDRIHRHFGRRLQRGDEKQKYEGRASPSEAPQLEKIASRQYVHNRSTNLILTSCAEFCRQPLKSRPDKTAPELIKKLCSDQISAGKKLQSLHAAIWTRRNGSPACFPKAPGFVEQCFHL
ncbi:hypothetical protein QR680_004478 [Steinernema hermaphroditum]|uniref:Uncharacterized protein n=1 Tax=Steinernema hermaphroditum TaxID=289476 RepID=A0AA39HR46_9BILA|nr:hypothetical protein QR680_004478 [Steinernema hermaphroditum]